MAHVSGNTAWVDYPAGQVITATRLNALEAPQDALYVSEHGAATRTKRVGFGAAFTGTAALTPGDVNAQTGWNVYRDTDSGWTSTTPASYYTIPISGRLWDLYFRVCTTAPANLILAAAIALNTASYANSIARDAKKGDVVIRELHAEARTFSKPLTAGDRLYFIVYGSANWTLGPFFGGIYPEIVIQDVGPA